MEQMKILVVSCDKYKSWWSIWKKNFKEKWTNCPYNYKIISNLISQENTIEVGDDLGWNRNLLIALEQIKEKYILLTLEDHILTKRPRIIEKVISIMNTNPKIGMIQLSKCWQPEKKYDYSVFGQFSREKHPFKICSLDATPIWCKELLIEMVKDIISYIPSEKDIGRQGAIEFEVGGTKLWCINEQKYQWEVLGVNWNAGYQSLYGFKNASTT